MCLLQPKRIHRAGFLEYWTPLPEPALRGAEGPNPGPARDRSEIQHPMSPGDNSHQDAILSHQMMIKRGTGMRGDKARD
jgi:hypothetical protein